MTWGENIAATGVACNAGLDDKYQKAIKELMHKHALSCEELTGNQLASVIAQALACGDIVRYVRADRNDHAQNVVYLPFAESERLRKQIEDYKKYVAEAMDYIIKETVWAVNFPQQCHARIRLVCEAVKVGEPLPFNASNH